MTSDIKQNGLIYYTLSGNTRTMIEKMSLVGFDIIDLSPRGVDISEVDLNRYDTLIIATSTLGDGEPPAVFKRLAPQLKRLEGKNIGLFGSGNSIYRFYGGALDLLADLLGQKNEVMFVYKFEEYPTPQATEELRDLLHQHRIPMSDTKETSLS